MIDQPLTLPCGAILSNRLCKAAMTEGLAGATGVPGDALNRLYGIWSDGGAGLLLSGNVQIDRDHLERPGNVVVDEEPDDGNKKSVRGMGSRREHEVAITSGRRSAMPADSVKRSLMPRQKPPQPSNWDCREGSLANRLP